MKKITLMIALLIGAFGYSQTIPVDFENDIADANWKGDSGVVVAVVDDSNGSNGKVGQVQAAITDASQPWQNAQLIMTTNLMDLTNATGSKIISVDVYYDDGDADDIGKDFLFKLEDELGNTANDENIEKVWPHKGNGWETLLVDFTTPDGSLNTANDGEWKKLIFFPCMSGTYGVDLWSGGKCDIVTYIDNVTANVGTSLILPPGDPLVMIEDFDSGGIVIGGAADDPLTGNFNSDALQSLMLAPSPEDPKGNSGEIITAAGAEPWQNAQLILNSNYIDLKGGNKTITVDVYSTSGYDFLLKLEDSKENGVAATEVAAEHNGTGWETLTFDFTIPKAGVTPNDDYQKLIFFPLFDVGINDFVPKVDAKSAITTAYIDNIMGVEGSAVLGVNDFEARIFSAYPNPTQNSWTVKTKNESILAIQVFDVLGKQVLSLSPNNREVIIDGSQLKAGLYFAQLKTAAGIKSIKLVKE